MYKNVIKIGILIIALVSFVALLYPKMNVPYIPEQSLDNRVLVGKFLPKNYSTSGQQVAISGKVQSGIMKTDNKILINNKAYKIKSLVVPNNSSIDISAIIEGINKDELKKYIENRVELPIVE